MKHQATSLPVQETPGPTSSTNNEPAADPPTTSSTATPDDVPQEVPGVLPGTSANLQIPQAVIQQLRNQVFGIDTMWVTSVENYQEAGVVFKGNVRSNNVEAAYKKMQERLKVRRGGMSRGVDLNA